MRIIHLLSATCLLSAGMAMAQSTFLVRKNGVSVFSITEDGSLGVWPGYYSENTPGTAATGELVFRENTLDATQEMITTPAGNLLVKGRVFRHAVMPTSTGNLVFREGPRAATLTKSGNLHLRAYGHVSTNPSASGSFATTSAVYASSGAQLISRFLSPTANYVTPRKNISPFFNNMNTGTWGFDASSVPLNGTLRIPTGTGPFPLVLFVHGNHSPTDYSDEGYLYLCSMLASQGIIAGTIDANFLNGNEGECDARAILHLEHVKQFRTWNAQSGHPLLGKVDLNRVMIVGHSRGGEGVGHASYFNGLSSVVADQGGPTIPLTGGANGLGPYNFGFKCIFAIAPTDSRYIPVNGKRGVDHNLFILHGGRDGDVSTFQGLATYDRSHKPNVASPSSTAAGFKALCYATKANHNYFNTTWDADSDPAQSMSRADQELLAKVYVGALAQGTLLGKTSQLNLLQVATDWDDAFRPTTSKYVTEYQDRQRTFFSHFEEDNNAATVSPPFTGSSTWFGQSFLEADLASEPQAHPYHMTKGIRLDWGNGNNYYDVILNTPVSNYQYLALRMGQSANVSNPVGGNQECVISAKDGAGTWGSVRSSAYVSLPYPNSDADGNRHTRMQTMRIPLKEYAEQGLNVNDIRNVQIEFGEFTSTGSVYVDELQFTY